MPILRNQKQLRRALYMKTVGIPFVICVAIPLLFLTACDRTQESGRETIFDKIINIEPKILDVPYLPPLCDEITDLKKGYVNVKDGKLYYEEEGQGIPMVLISGGPGGTHHGFHPYFSQLKGVARIIYYDQRGTGQSSKDDTAKTYTVNQAVEDLESLRKALKIDKWVLLGWSYGGLLAQLYALKYPRHCAGLVLVAAQSGVKEPITEPIRDRMFISQAEDDAINGIKKKYSEGKITGVQSFYNQQLAGDWKHQSYYKPTQEQLIRKALYSWAPAPRFIETIRPESDAMSLEGNLEGKFDDFTIPTLIFEGKWDLLWWNPNRAEVMRKNHPHAQIEIFDKSGHYIFADEPEKFFTLLGQFLEKAHKASL